MKRIEPDEQRAFLAAPQHNSLAKDDFKLVETDTTDPKGDENFGLQGYVAVTKRSTRVTREYPIGYETDWVRRFGKDLDACAFDKLE